VSFRLFRGEEETESARTRKAEKEIETTDRSTVRFSETEFDDSLDDRSVLHDRVAKLESLSSIVAKNRRESAQF
jgi:hypothetical protein